MIAARMIAMERQAFRSKRSGDLLLPRPACGERVGVRGRIRKVDLADRPPHPDRTGRCEASPRRSRTRALAATLKPSLRAKRSNPWPQGKLDCFVAALLAMTKRNVFAVTGIRLKGVPWRR